MNRRAVLAAEKTIGDGNLDAAETACALITLRCGIHMVPRSPYLPEDDAVLTALISLLFLLPEPTGTFAFMRDRAVELANRKSVRLFLADKKTRVPWQFF
jgi:hypothetical protein